MTTILRLVAAVAMMATIHGAEPSVDQARPLLQPVRAQVKTGEVNEVDDPRLFWMAVMQHRGPVLVAFGAGWCVPCKTQAPHLAAYAAATDGVLVLHVDTDRSTDIAWRHAVETVPASFVYVDGRLVGGIKAGLSAAGFKRLVDDSVRDSLPIGRTSPVAPPAEPARTP